MKRRVLLVEDEAAVADYLGAFLQQEGFEVVRAATLQAARSFIPEQFHLFLLDLNLPDGTGDELLSFIRQNHPDIPVLMVTGAALNDDRIVKALNSGASGCINKAARIEEIMRHLRLTLGE